MFLAHSAINTFLCSFPPLLCAFVFSVDCSIRWLHHGPHFHSCCQWLSDGLPLPNLFSGSPLHCCQSTSNPDPIGWRCSVDQMAGPCNWPKSSGGKEGIDLSVVLGDQLIPIVCASTDSPMCLICYGLFLLGQDKTLSHHFPLWATNQIKSKRMTARRGFLPRLWLADHNKGRPSIWKVVCAE